MSFLQLRSPRFSNEPIGGGVVNTSIAQVAATLTFSGGTQADVAVNIVSVAQVGATITFTGGNQSTALNLSQSAATLTFTGGTQAVASIQDVSVSQSGATLTFTGGTQTISGNAPTIVIEQFYSNIGRSSSFTFYTY